MELNKEFWYDKKVFISGHTGFKGSWLSLWLHQLGAKVYGYSLEPPTRPNLYEALALDANIEGVIGDIRTYDFLNQSISDVNPEILIHMAAQPLVRDSYLDPRYTYETNIMGTVNILDIAKKNKTIKSVLVITSDKCYVNLEIDYALGEHTLVIFIPFVLYSLWELLFLCRIH